ncbi:pectate lyase C [Cyathus striatus]|nr:pectate lyase C [Cyathus striatus]
MLFTQLFTLAIFSITVSASHGLEKRSVHQRAATNVFPTPPKTSSLSKPITVAKGKTFTPPTAYTRYDRGSGSCEGQKEGGDADAVFLLEDGATLSRVVIGKNQAEGIHCLGSCTLDHVYFEDVCEDAITLKQSSGTSTINYGGVCTKGASDKVIQHNGGGKVVINNFYVENFGKLYRSCGNCKTQHARSVELNNIWAVNGKVLVGINSNYGDTAKIRTTKVSSVKTICQKFTGNNKGTEPPTAGSGPDSKYCLYATSDVTSA